MIESGKLIGFGIIGSGFMGRTHAETISTLVNGARLVSISGGPKAASLAAEYGVQSFAPCEETFMRDDVDVVVLATPHNVHAEHAIAAAKAGKHLLVEKPMACSVEQCDAIIAACRPAGLKCAIMYTHRNRIGCLKARELIASGRLGRVVHIRSYQIVPGGMAVVPPWQLDAENLGLLFGHGIHNLDALRWFSGQDIHAIYAKCRNFGKPCAVEGTSDVLATMADGSTGYVFCSFEAPKPNFPRSEIAARIICERGLVDVDVYGETRASIDGGPWETIARQEPIDWAGRGAMDPVRLRAYAAGIQDLVDAIREDREPANSAWDGRQAVAAALAAYESSRTGKEIVLDA